MNISEKLASSLGRRDETPNQDLAITIVATADKAAVEELVHLLQTAKKDVQSDCIKVLYEIGERKPSLIAEHWQAFLDLVDVKNNRLAWGAMMALDSIANLKPDELFGQLPRILAATDGGSVITRDHVVGILIKLAAMSKYSGTVFPLLLEQLAGCPPNQLPMYAELALPMVTGDFKEGFSKIIQERLPDLPKESQKKRLEKVLKKLG